MCLSISEGQAGELWITKNHQKRSTKAVNSYHKQPWKASIHPNFGRICHHISIYFHILPCISINFLPPRLETIMDFDQVVVLEKGSVAEQGSAQELRDKPQGLFRRMLAAKRWWWGWGLGGALRMGDTKPLMDFIIFPMNTWYFKGFFRQTPHFQTRAPDEGWLEYMVGLQKMGNPGKKSFVDYCNPIPLRLNNPSMDPTSSGFIPTKNPWGYLIWTGDGIKIRLGWALQAAVAKWAHMDGIDVQHCSPAHVGKRFSSPVKTCKCWDVV